MANPYSGGAGLGAGSGIATNKPPPKPTAPKPTKPTRTPAPQRGPKPTRPAMPAHPPRPRADKTKTTPIPVDPLAPLTPKQVGQAATSTITKAYAPQFTDLGQQSTTAQNLYKQQASDAKYFADWLASKSTEMQQAVGQTNQKMADLLAGIRGQTQAAVNTLPGNLEAAANAQGTGVNQSQNTAYTTAIPQILAGQQVREGGEAQRAGINAELGPVEVAQTGDVNQARVQALRATEAGTLTTTLKNIANERIKLQQARTGDIAKEIARLNGIEINKRQFLLSQSALEEKLKISGANTASEILARSNATTINQQNANTSAARALETQRHNAAMEQINKTHYSSTSAQAAARLTETKRHNQAIEAGKTTGSTKKTATPAQIRVVRNQLNKTVQAIKYDMQRWHKGQPNAAKLAYHDLLNQNPGAPRWVGDPGLLNAAFNIITIGGLGTGDVSYLQTLGIPDPNSWYGQGAGVSAGPRRT